MTPLVLHPNTQKQFEHYTQTPTHALIIVGPADIGKATVAKHLAAEIMRVETDKLLSSPYFLLVQPEKQSIGIDAVRAISRFLQLKTIGANNLRRVVLIEDAQLMTIEAQNAFLKSLEEPPEDTAIILTASQPQRLLPTITSRLQTLVVHIPPRAALEAVFGSSKEFNRAYSLSGGLPGLIQALLNDNQDHPLFAAVIKAKELLQNPAFSRLAAVDAITRDKQQVPLILDALNRIAQIGLEQAAVKKQNGAIKRWQQLLEAIVATQSAINKNANLKLALTNLFLQV